MKPMLSYLALLHAGGVQPLKLLAGLRSLAARRSSSLSEDVAAALDSARLPIALILASRDGTAIAAEAEWSRPAYR